MPGSPCSSSSSSPHSAVTNTDWWHLTLLCIGPYNPCSLSSFTPSWPHRRDLSHLFPCPHSTIPKMSPEWFYWISNHTSLLLNVFITLAMEEIQTVWWSTGLQLSPGFSVLPFSFQALPTLLCRDMVPQLSVVSPPGRLLWVHKCSFRLECLCPSSLLGPLNTRPMINEPRCQTELLIVQPCLFLPLILISADAVLHVWETLHFSHVITLTLNSRLTHILTLWVTRLTMTHTRLCVVDPGLSLHSSRKLSTPVQTSCSHRTPTLFPSPSELRSKFSFLQAKLPK
jgi:hypothetical protein